MFPKLFQPPGPLMGLREGKAKGSQVLGGDSIFGAVSLVPSLYKWGGCWAGRGTQGHSVSQGGPLPPGSGLLLLFGPTKSLCPLGNHAHSTRDRLAEVTGQAKGEESTLEPEEARPGGEPLRCGLP